MLPQPTLSRDITGQSDPFDWEDDDDDDVGVDIGDASLVKIFNPRELVQKQASIIEEATDLLGVSADDAAVMLRHHQWNPEILGEAFFEDESKVRRALCVSIGVAEAPAGQLCGICFCDPPMALLPCADPGYCAECWEQYVRTSVRDGKGCLDLRCPFVGCGERLRPSHTRRLLPEDLRARFDQFLLQSFVDDNPSLRWCPGPGCDRAAWLSTAAPTKEVQCVCGFSWCFTCKEDWHAPVQCNVVEEWNKKNRDTSQDATWILANTKPCPKCKNPIEKNGGCMHMTCRKPAGCNHEFCWICGKDWKGHTDCNSFKQQESSDVRNARSELQRYVHYFERFQAHEKAQHFANVQQREVIDNITQVLAGHHGFPVKDVECLADAVTQIVASRRFLKWTYAHAFVENLQGKAKELFEFYQAQLEGTLERLSDIMENTHWAKFLDFGPDASREEFRGIRAQIVSLTGVVKEFFNSLSDTLHRGQLVSL